MGAVCSNISTRITTGTPVPIGHRSHELKKTIYTLCVDDYAPEITSLTYPLLERYAAKIGADFHVITERKYPDFPLTYEKFQVWDLAQANGDNWSFFLDSDTLVHPDLFDITEYLPRDTVLHNGSDIAGNRFRADKYFRRDGRRIGSCTWAVLCSDWCLDIWHPLEGLILNEALDHIYPTVQESIPTDKTEKGEIVPKAVVTLDHLIDDFLCSRNISRYGLKFETLLNLQKRIGDPGCYLAHQYLLTTEQKVEWLKHVLRQWKLA